ncbi:MFS transporter [Lihuaxuella thermophila]|uniref:Predicted arabinose efflux permease, MFS family n=1 Tax=Lihuaxuella thermophila TaxID=1173111 RepID=A0A1H8IE83_9BACL|nr:MFS transporter [Lihuaxuella thermophila]SEN67093.1 Predicted arabinose efflux permease, MFS family [Lihuaxuella thermophila]
MTDQVMRRGRNITVFATFLAFMGIGVVDPILPVISEQIGASHWEVEMLFTAYIFTMALMMIPSGLAAVKFGDKKLMVAGLGIVTVFALLCGSSDTIFQLSLFRSGWGLGNSMFFSTTMTLLIALSGEVSQAVGLYEAAIGLGMAGGPLVGGILGGFSWRYPFFATGLLIFTAFLLVIFLVPRPEKKIQRKTAGWRELVHLLSYRPFLQGAVSSMLYFYGFFVVLAYSPLVIHLTAIQIGLVFFGWGLLLAYGSAVLSHRLEKAYPPKTLIPYGLLAFAVLLVLFFLISVIWVQITLIVLSGLISGLNNALFTSYMMEVSPYDRGVTSGVYNFVRWIGAAVAPILSGLIGHALSPHMPFLIAAVVGLFAFLFILIPVKQPASELK